jgi:nicotinamide riboside transporter PnuC
MGIVICGNKKWKERGQERLEQRCVTVSLLKTMGFFVHCVKGIVQCKVCICADHQLEG